MITIAIIILLSHASFFHYISRSMILMKGVEIIETFVTITAKFKIHIYLFAQKAIIIKLGFLLFAIFISFYKVFLKKIQFIL